MAESPKSSTVITGRAVLVTGSSRGLGREIALRFGHAGWNVLVNCVRSVGAAEEVAAEARSFGSDAIVVQADISLPTASESLIDAAMRRWGRLDCLVNNAGTVCTAQIVSLSDALWDDAVATNLTAPVALIRRAAEVMRPGSSIVNVSSLCGLWGCAGVSAYSAAKGALAGYTKGAAGGLAGKGIRINAVAPGYMPTEMGRSAPAAMALAQSQHVMSRLADPRGAAEFIFQLAQMPSVTGQVFVLDGRIR